MVRPIYAVPHGSLQVFIIILYENVFQSPLIFPTQVSLSPEQSTLNGNNTLILKIECNQFLALF
jgi:hypothetical protein